MTTAEAAEALGVTRSLVLRFIRDNRLQAERHGRDWWITPEALEAFKAVPRVMGWRKGRKRKPIL